MLLLLALASCGRPDGGEEGRDDGAEATARRTSALERAAIESGAIADPAALSPVGLFQSRHEAGQDIMCVAPADGKRHRFGLEAVFGTEQSCRGEGTAHRAGDKLILHFSGRAGCIIVARYEGDRIALPGVVDLACDSLCTGRGSLAGVSLPRLSGDAGAARAARDRSGNPLCHG
jgi:hypothetical protein